MNNNKRILYIGGFELPDKNAAAHRVIANAKIFAKLGYEIIFLGITKTGIKNDVPVKETLGTLNYYSFPQKYPTNKWQWVNFISSISHVKKIIKSHFLNKIDIIVAYDYPAFSLWKLTNFCRKNKIKLIADAAEWYEPQGSVLFRIVKGIDTYYRMKLLHKQVNGLIVISRYLYDFYKNQNKILIPPLIDKCDNKWTKSNYSLNDVCELVYVGSPGFGKKDRLDLIVYSLARIKPKVKSFRFTIIGLTKTDFLDAFNLNHIPQDLEDCLFFKGRTPHMEAINYIKNSDYSIFLRDNNRVNSAGFPTKFVESIACGTPVLTNSTSDIYQYLKNGELGYFIDIKSQKALDDSLIKAVNQDNSQILKMKDSCFNYWGFHFENFEKEMSYFLKKL